MPDPSLAAAAPADLFEVVDCPFCGGSETRPVTGTICDGPHHGVPEPYRSLGFRMLRCSGCGLVYQRERLRPEHLAVFYDDEGYFCYRSFEKRGALIQLLATLSARAEIRLIEKLRNPSNDRFLDFGCGNGSWLELFRHCGAPWRMQGCEISQHNVDHVRALGFEALRCGDADVDRVFEPDSLGVVFLHHVIEHVPNPREFLARLARVLAPGGIVVGQTPNHDCLERRVFGDHWGQWHLPHHTVVFDEGTLRQHAAAAGLEVALLRSSPSGATQWAAALLKWRASRAGRLFRWTDEPLHGPLTLLATPLALIQCWLHRTSHMDFALRKPESP